MLSNTAPFHLAGNIYYVGTDKISSHLIDTGEGLILIDTGYDENAEMIIDSMSILGFDIHDVKYIIHSHGHGDHTHASAELSKRSGAKTWLHKDDERFLEGRFVPDHYIQDGDTLRLGNTEITFLHTPGHSLGTVTLFFHTEVDGKRYRVGMFGGAGVNQLKRNYLKTRGLSYLQRVMFFETLERLQSEHVDIPLGNHPWHTHTLRKHQQSLTAKDNPFIDPNHWKPFLIELGEKLVQIIKEESQTGFVNYAHRGASEYAPENTMMAFYLGLYMGANGIETDVQLTKDNVPVLFHDDTLLRMTGESGSIQDYTYHQLRQMHVTKNGLEDKIVSLKDFLDHFAFRDIWLAIELKQPGTAKAVADAVREYGIAHKTVVTSFHFSELRELRSYAPELTTGYLTKNIDQETLSKMREVGIDELCPKADEVTSPKVEHWHMQGFNVRAWGVFNQDLMHNAFASGVDGMTVNFPDKLTAIMTQE